MMINGLFCQKSMMLIVLHTWFLFFLDLEYLNQMYVILFFETDVSFMVDTKKLREPVDVKCDDCGTWVKNGVRKLYLNVRNQNYSHKHNVSVIQSGDVVRNLDIFCSQGIKGL